MNAPSNAIPNTPAHAHTVAPADIPASRRFYWCLLRELWESRSIYIAPLAVAALILIGFLIRSINLPQRLHSASSAEQHAIIVDPYTTSALLIMFTTFLVAAFYSLDALYGERRDRSILFWKSLPVSDLATVLTKAAIPILVLPLLTFAVTVSVHWIMLLFASARLLGTGNIALLWKHASPFQMWTILLYHLVAVHGFWYAPFYGYFLLVSSWARRAPILWAALPLLAIGLVERIAFSTRHFADFLWYRFSGGAEGAPFTVEDMTMASMNHLSLSQFLSNPGLWIGLALTAAFLVAAARLRRSRMPI